MCAFFCRSYHNRRFPSAFLRWAWMGMLALALGLVAAGPARATAPDIRIPEAGTAGDTGGLRIGVDLPKAKVYLDGELEGLAHPGRPLVRPVLPAGPVRVTVRADGVPVQRRELTIRPGEMAEVRFRLRPRPPEVRRHLAAATAALSAGRLSTPPKDNAVFHFRAALDREPDLPEARGGLRQVLAAHQQRAAQAETEGAFGAALQEYRAALSVARFLAEDTGADLAPEMDDLAAGRDRAARLARPVAELLREADDLFRRERYLAPPEANAFDRYRAVLVKDPDNAHARERIREMAERYSRLARDTASEDLARAATYHRNRARLLTFLREELGISVDRNAVSATQERAKTLRERAAAAEALAREGDTFFIARRMLTPARGNAFEKYRAALELDPTNRRARERLGEMVAFYRQRAVAAFDSGRLEPAWTGYRRMETVAAFAGSVLSDPGMSAAAAEARERRASLEMAAERVEAGDRYRAEGRWTAPPEACAVSAYREALFHHPGNVAALAGLREMMRALTETAVSAEAGGRLASAAAALSRYVAVARVAAAATDDPTVRTALWEAENRIARLTARHRQRRLRQLRNRLDQYLMTYRELTKREERETNVAGQVVPVLRQLVETLDGLEALYESLPASGTAEKLDRLRQTRAALKREIAARAEKAF